MKYIFLVAGKGSRLHPLTLEHPKSMFKLDENTTLLQRMVKLLKKNDPEADIVVVTGPVTTQSLPRVLRAISQVPEPRCIVTMGSCPQSGNVFRGSYSVAGPLSKYVHVDVAVAGCAPKPEAVIDGLALATQILKEKREKM